MHTLESLKRQIKVAEDLQSVVKTMKSLAAVNIRQYEDAVLSLVDYTRTVEMGLRIVLRNHPQTSQLAGVSPRKRLGAIVLGSDQGMCGQLNDQIVRHALGEMQTFADRQGDSFVLAVGQRVASRLEEAGMNVEMGPAVPGSIEGITPAVQDILLILDNWLLRRHIDHVLLFFTEHASGVLMSPHTLCLLPVDQAWLRQMSKEKWPTRALPTFTMHAEQLFSALIRQYLFISLYRGLAEALASENASRLASMHGAERNIDKRLGQLKMLYNQQRQTAIDGELLDIVSGFQALSDEGNDGPARRSIRARSQ